MYKPELWDIESLAGQRLVLGFEGPECHKGIKKRIEEIRPAGIILFSTNIENKDQLKRLVKELQKTAKEAELPPLIIAIDQEGGPVARLREPDFEEFPPIRELKSPEEAFLQAREMGAKLKELKINMNCAPVLDISSYEEKSIMEKRAFKGDALRVSEMGISMIKGFKEEGVIPVAKHFPGIGRTILDSHYSLPILDIEKEELLKSDILPFKKAIEEEVPCIMLSHILYKGLDSKWPASLSCKIAKELLRDELGHKGLVLSDDLDMKAINYNMDIIMERIVEAELDLALICHESEDIDLAFDTLKKLAGKEELKENFINSAKRVLKLKRDYKIISK